MADPGASDIAAVRFLIGDPDGGTGTTTQLTDDEITFALDQVAQSIYPAAVICARALAARYARKVDSKFETIESKFSQLRDNYVLLARNLERDAKKQGGLGVPYAGGISRADVESAEADEDRVKPFFYSNLLNNPPPPND
jgi:hypothetical protein